MKRLLIHLLMCTVAGIAFGEGLDARIRTRESERIYSGALVERGPGFVLFRQDGISQTIRITDGELAFIKFEVEEDLKTVQQQFTAGAYSDAAAAYNRILPRFLPYSSLPSNLSEEFVRWPAAVYWSGDYTLTIKLTKVLKATSGSKKAELYGLLARLEMGESEAVCAFLESPEAREIVPEDSAVDYYIKACLLKQGGQPLEAIRTVTRLISRHSRDADWMPQAELLCAELYFELNMPESAEAVLGDIQYFYTDNKGIQEKAAALAAKQK